MLVVVIVVVVVGVELDELDDNGHNDGAELVHKRLEEGLGARAPVILPGVGGRAVVVDELLGRVAPLLELLGAHEQVLAEEELEHALQVLLAQVGLLDLDGAILARLHAGVVVAHRSPLVLVAHDQRLDEAHERNAQLVEREPFALAREAHVHGERHALAHAHVHERERVRVVHVGPHAHVHHDQILVLLAIMIEQRLVAGGQESVTLRDELVEAVQGVRDELRERAVAGRRRVVLEAVHDQLVQYLEAVDGLIQFERVLVEECGGGGRRCRFGRPRETPLHVEEGELGEHVDDVGGELFEELAVAEEPLGRQRLDDLMECHEGARVHQALVLDGGAGAGGGSRRWRRFADRLEEATDELGPLVRQLEARQLAEHDGHLARDLELRLAQVAEKLRLEQSALLVADGVRRRLAPVLVHRVLQAHARHAARVRLQRVVGDYLLDLVVVAVVVMELQAIKY